MKNRYRRKYVEAIMPVIESRCRGKSLPICMDAQQLLEEACRREHLVHSYSATESHRIVRDLFEEIDRQCKGRESNDVFPVAAIKCTSRIVKTIGHGRELVIDDKTTAAFYEANAYASRSESYTGFVFFGQAVTTSHPILRTAYAVRSKAVRTEGSRIDEKVNGWQRRGLIDSSDAEHLLVMQPIASVKLIGS
jgi:hypothetical protein